MGTRRVWLQDHDGKLLSRGRLSKKDRIYLRDRGTPVTDPEEVKQLLWTDYTTSLEDRDRGIPLFRYAVEYPDGNKGWVITSKEPFFSHTQILIRPQPNPTSHVWSVTTRSLADLDDPVWGRVASRDFGHWKVRMASRIADRLTS